MKVVLVTPPTVNPLPAWDKAKGASREILSDLYLTQGLSSNKIATLFGTTAPSVCNKLHSYKIPIRPQAEDLNGRKFGRWTIIRKTDSRKNRTQWLCRCE